MGKPRKPRSDAKMYKLPKNIIETVNDFLINHNMSYAEIISWLSDKGYTISQSSLSKYAFKIFEAAQRIADDLEKTKHIIEAIEKNPDADATKAVTAILKSGLLKKITSAADEFNDIPIEQAGKLFIQLSKAEAAHNKNDFAMKSKKELAFKEFEQIILDEIKQYPELRDKFQSLLSLSSKTGPVLAKKNPPVSC